jgi:hypothetical protein
MTRITVARQTSLMILYGRGLNASSPKAALLTQNLEATFFLKKYLLGNPVTFHIVKHSSRLEPVYRDNSRRTQSSCWVALHVYVAISCQRSS